MLLLSVMFGTPEGSPEEDLADLEYTEDIGD
jgi:hypothetical protein